MLQARKRTRNCCYCWLKLQADSRSPECPRSDAAGSNSECRRIQHSTWKNGWNSVPQADKDAWKASKCPEKLRVRPKQERIGACPRFPKSMKADATKKVKALENSHRGEVCAQTRQLLSLTLPSRSCRDG